MTLVMISRGNIPSHWAHSFQIMKMGESLNKWVADFRMLVQVHPNYLDHSIDYERWYGIKTPFPIVRLPNAKLPPKIDFDDWRYPEFDRMAVEYAASLKDPVIYTRSPWAWTYALERGMSTIIESHSGGNNHQVEALRHAVGKPGLLGIVTISDPLRDKYVKMGFRKEQILVAPDAVNPASFEGLSDRFTLRKELGLPHEKFLSVYCGNLYKKRGIEDIFQAADKLPDAHFLMVGGKEADVRRYARKAKHLSNITFTGFVENERVPQYLKAADALLLPYSRKCTTASWMSPMKLYESMASGTPIIASRLDALMKLLIHEQNALLTEADCGLSLADAITTLSQNPDLAQRIAHQAKEDVAPFTWDNRAKTIQETFCPWFVTARV